MLWATLALVATVLGMRSDERTTRGFRFGAASQLPRNLNWSRSLGVNRHPKLDCIPVCRLLHHYHIVNIRGNSYRMREHQDLLRAGPEEGARGVPA